MEESVQNRVNVAHNGIRSSTLRGQPLLAESETLAGYLQVFSGI